MPFTPGSFDGLFDGTAQVEIVPSPAASTQRMVKTITVNNLDDEAHTVTLNLLSFGNTRQIISQELQPGSRFVLQETYVLDDPNKYIVGKLSEATLLAEVQFISVWSDMS